MQQYKIVLVYINDSHKNLLEKFFDQIDFYYYTVQTHLESVWSSKLKHKNNNVWPGSDAIFRLFIKAENLDWILKMLKTFRMALPYEIVMGTCVIPIETVIPDLEVDNTIPVDDKLLELLKNEYAK